MDAELRRGQPELHGAYDRRLVDQLAEDEQGLIEVLHRRAGPAHARPGTVLVREPLRRLPYHRPWRASGTRPAGGECQTRSRLADAVHRRAGQGSRHRRSDRPRTAREVPAGADATAGPRNGRRHHADRLHRPAKPRRARRGRNGREADGGRVPGRLDRSGGQPEVDRRSLSADSARAQCRYPARHQERRRPHCRRSGHARAPRRGDRYGLSGIPEGRRSEDGALGVRPPGRCDHGVRKSDRRRHRRRCQSGILPDGPEVLAPAGRDDQESILRKDDVRLRPPQRDAAMRTLIVVLAALLSSAAPATADLSVAMHDGRVSIVAKDATVRQILAEWARVGQTKIVNVEQIPGGPVTLVLENVTETHALEILLRPLSGYIAAPRAVAAANLSAYDRIIVLPKLAEARPAMPVSAAASSAMLPSAPPPPPV